MPKEIPECPKKPAPAPDAARRYEIELITPMFGGGVEPRVNDSSVPIRPTTIRGQLQFWWRATVGAQYTTLKELRAAQTEVWGSTERASRVQVRAELLGSRTEPNACAVIKPSNRGRDQVNWEPPFQNTALPYALFPFQGKPANREGPKVDPAACTHKATFQLTIICDESIDFVKQVETAIWAWVNFGGLGSRTRRGCGAIYCQRFAPRSLDSIDEWYRDRVPAVNWGIRDWPTMPTHFLCFPQAGRPFDQWNRVISLLRDFRQKAGVGPGHARPPGPDRSWYPEPDTIRRITTSHSPGHEPQGHLSGGNSLPDGFPRAELGLPIVFKFLDDKSGDPTRTTLQPYVGGEIKERMASPVVLRPLAFSKEVAAPIILPLQTRGVDHIALVNDNGADLTPRHALPIQNAGFVGYPDSPLRGLTSKGSALEAFLNLAVQTAGTNTAHPNTGYRKVPA